MRRSSFFFLLARSLEKWLDLAKAKSEAPWQNEPSGQSCDMISSWTAAGEARRSKHQAQESGHVHVYEKAIRTRQEWNRICSGWVNLERIYTYSKTNPHHIPRDGIIDAGHRNPIRRRKPSRAIGVENIRQGYDPRCREDGENSDQNYLTHSLNDGLKPGINMEVGCFEYEGRDLDPHTKRDQVTRFCAPH